MSNQTCSIYISVAITEKNKANQQGGIGISVYGQDQGFVHEANVLMNNITDCAELELVALVESLEYAMDGDTLYSSSEYCVKGFNEWLDNWKAKGWRKSDKKPVANRHLWQQIDNLRASKFVEVKRASKHGDSEMVKRAIDMAKNANCRDNN